MSYVLQIMSFRVFVILYTKRKMDSLEKKKISKKSY